VPIHRFEAGMEFFLPLNQSKGSQMYDFFLQKDADENGFHKTELIYDEYAGKKFTLLKVDERQGIGGLRTFFVFQVEGQEELVEYRVMMGKSALEALERKGIGQIKYLIAQKDVQEAQELVGKTVYIKEFGFKKYGEQGATKSVHPLHKKFFAAEVIKVEEGVSLAPVRIVFEMPDKSLAYHDVVMSGTNIDPSFSQEGAFDKFISFDNPKIAFEGSEIIWSLICSGKIATSMTKEQVKLTWGEPLGVIKDGDREQWEFHGNSYVVFKNNKVVEIR